MSESLFNAIESLRMELDKHRKGDLKEYPTRTIFIDPLLQALGWNVKKPDEVELEYSTIDGKSVDYAPKINRKPVLFIEAKPLKDPLTDVKGITQVVSYAANAGVEWCILTNGVTYKVYRSTEKVEAPDKLLFEISLDPKETESMSIQQVTAQFAYFSRDAMAKGLLDEIGEQVFTTRKIRKALDKVFMEPPNTLIEFICSAIRDNTIKPMQVKKALTRLWSQTSEVEITPTYEFDIGPMPPDKTRVRSKDSESEEEAEKRHLKNKDLMKTVYERLKEEILAIGDNIVINPHPIDYIAFGRMDGIQFCGCYVKQRHIRVHLPLMGLPGISEELTPEYPNSKWGYTRIREQENINEKLMRWIRMAYEQAKR